MNIWGAFNCRTKRVLRKTRFRIHGSKWSNGRWYVCQCRSISIRSCNSVKSVIKRCVYGNGNCGKVAVENTTYQFDKAFDYLVPQHLLKGKKEGCRVMVPLAFPTVVGRCDTCVGTDRGWWKRKSVVTVLDEAPFSHLNFEYGCWLKERYFCTLYDAVKLLPTGFEMKLKNCRILWRHAYRNRKQLCTEEEFITFCPM